MEKDEPTLANDLSVTTTTQKEKGDSSGKRSKSTHACDLCKKKKVRETKMDVDEGCGIKKGDE